MIEVYKKRKKLKQKLKNKDLIIACWLSYPELSIVETFCSLPIDLIAIDLEHTPISLEQTKNIILASQGRGVPCLPRPVSHSNDLTKPILDFGSDGMFYPMVNTEDELEKIINSFKYPNIGKRSFGVNRAHNYDLDFEEYVNNWNETSSLILQIESKEGVSNIESLIKNPHVDGVMIGPYDLSGSYGYPGKIDMPEVSEACDKVLMLCNKYNKTCGIQIKDTSSININKQIKKGYNLIILSSDLFILSEWVKSQKYILDKFL